MNLPIDTINYFPQLYNIITNYTESLRFDSLQELLFFPSFLQPPLKIRSAISFFVNVRVFAGENVIEIYFSLGWRNTSPSSNTEETHCNSLSFVGKRCECFSRGQGKSPASQVISWIREKPCITYGVSCPLLNNSAK